MVHVYSVISLHQRISPPAVSMANSPGTKNHNGPEEHEPANRTAEHIGVVIDRNEPYTDNPEGHQLGELPVELDMPTNVPPKPMPNHDLGASNAVNPIMLLIHDQELGKAILGYAVPVVTGLVLNHNKNGTPSEARLVVIALCLGVTLTWVGMLLRNVYHKIATAMEFSGVALVFVAFFGLVASFLPPWQQWVAYLCCFFACLPLLLGLIPIKSTEGTT